MTGRAQGRGQSKNIHCIDRFETEEEANEYRRRQVEEARALGLDESQVTPRRRGGFRIQELRTIPDNIETTRVTNLAAVRQVDILCNYVPLRAMQGRTVYMYRVDFEPQVESAQLMRRLFRLASVQRFKKKPIYDGAHECRSSERLSGDQTTVDVVDPDNANTKFTVKFTRTSEVHFGMEMLRIYNSHMKRFLEMLGFYQPQPRCYVHPEFKSPVGSDIMMLRGYSTSANMFDENRMLMNLEPCHKIMQLSNVLQMMNQIRQSNPTNMKEAIRKELVGKLVVTAYNKRCYRVDEIDFDSGPSSTFKTRDGKTISFNEYFNVAHNIKIRVPDQALLVAVPNNQRRREESDVQVKLIPELCNIAGLTEKQRIDNRLKMDLIRASQVPPSERVNHMKEFLKRFHSCEEIKTELECWGYSYDTEPLKVRAHILTQSRVGFGRVAKEPMSNWMPVNQEHANFEVNGLAQTRLINKLAIITTRRDLPAKQEIINKLKQGFNRVDLKVESVQQVDVPEGDSAGHYIQRLRALPQDTTVAIVIMNAQNKERYDAIKKAASVEMGLVTQVVTNKLMTDPRKAGGAATKIAIQIAAKIGAEPWYIDIPLRCCMVCGYDTYHDTANRGRSYGAFLASMNDRFSRWWSKADAHDRLEEMSSQVATNLLEALGKYKEVNNKFPERVIIYRDGVGEGQLEHVFNVELQRIQQILKEANNGIRLTMMIVSKRIGARFYMRASSGFVNPPPGTIVDHGCTRQGRYDFYLVSQSTRQGTVTPTYYNIIADQSGFSPDILQKMAYKFCLLYYNWSGSVRVPAPCQYAHKLAVLCGEHLHAQPSAVLDDRLHFL